jgi:hypothetical protein
MKRFLLSGSVVTALALASLACSAGTTEPLPDLSVGEGQAPGGTDSGSTTEPDTTGSTSPGDTTTTGETPLPADEIVTLYASSQSGVVDEGQEIIDDAGAWAAAWNSLHSGVVPVPPVPEVDFAARRVVLVTAGERPNGGHRLELVEVTSGDTGMTVRVNDVVPGPSCLTAQVISHPALAISVPRTADAPAVLVERVYDGCG